MSRNIFTDNPDFYPTPKALINEMLALVDASGKVIAGGVILDALADEASQFFTNE